MDLAVWSPLDSIFPTLGAMKAPMFDRVLAAGPADPNAAVLRSPSAISLF